MQLKKHIFKQAAIGLLISLARQEAAQASFYKASSNDNAYTSQLQQSPYRLTINKNVNIDVQGLTDQGNNTIDAHYIKNNLQGQKIALYFGFPDCEEFCGPSIIALQQIKKELAQRDIQLLLIASKVKKDGTPYSPRAMAGWASKLKTRDGKDPIALTASANNVNVLEKIWTDGRVNNSHGTHIAHVSFFDEAGNLKAAQPAIKPTNQRDNKGHTIYAPQPQKLRQAIQRAYGPLNTPPKQALNF